MTFNSDMWISLIQNLANNAEIDSCLQHLHIRQLSLTSDEWWNYSTSKPSKLVTVKAFNRAHHTPGLGALVANLVSVQIDVRDALVDFKCLGQDLEAATDQCWHLDFSAFHPKHPKTWFLKSSRQKWHLTETCKIFWSKTWKNNPEINSCLQHLHIRQLSLNRDEWWNYRTSKPSKFVTVTRCREHDIFHQIAAAFSGAGHTPGLGALVANLVVVQIDVRDALVDFKCLGQGLEAATDQGWRPHPGFYCSNRDHWNPENTCHLTLTCESLWYRT